ncbi:hypothetical protein GNI_155680 [Gregarina niphandrodes]|uniref:Uncharacterized protein n=1 Tax=Gregarina niphandrodes TaxID=110365 RepID=A0A023AZK0_GRENI|nr:hypothetical protein GNI_155680 [Gregarina niphandrodes]EZG43926.1 hypothetical protein GNI_155680 [Gregarina niphandrodes]|eukprot:XP_011132897.1 hypothetical protein GNI_155680 [Gregarina niphandrodes]
MRRIQIITLANIFGTYAVSPQDNGMTSIVQIPLNGQSVGGLTSPGLRGPGRPEKDLAAISLAKGLTDEQILSEKNNQQEREEMSAAARSAQLSLTDTDAKTVESAKRDLDQARKDYDRADHRLRVESQRDRHEETMARKGSTRAKLKHNKMLDQLEDEDNEVNVMDQRVKGEEREEANELAVEKAEGLEAKARQKAEGLTAMGNLSAAGKIQLAADLAKKMPSSPESALHELLNCSEIVEPESPDEVVEEEHAEDTLSHVDCVPDIDVGSVQDMLKKKVTS